METILLNAVSKPQHRKALLNGRQYYVVPITSIVPGVLNGSKGALYYPPDECSANVPAWDGIPIVVYHPTRSGVAISAQDPDVMESQGVGFLDNSSFIPKNGKPARLQHEAWFDVEKTRRVDNRIIQSIEANRPIELSTGLYTDNDKAPLGANDRGKGYDYIARNYRPDHLAVLPDQVGACSINDGCGVLVNGESSMPGKRKKPTKNTVLDQPRHPKEGKYQGKAPNAVRKGYEDTGEPDTEADPIDDEDEEIGQGDRDPEPRKTGGEVTGNSVLLDLPSVRRLIEAGQGDLVVTNEEGQLVVNPFVSEQQRKYLWSQEPEIAEAWAHGEHTSDKGHKMPDETGADVKGPLAKKERKEQKKGKKTTDNSNPEGHNQYTQGATGDALKHEVLKYVKDNGAVHTSTGGVTSAKSLLDMRRDLGHKKFNANTPLKNPVHKAIVDLIGSGHLSRSDSGWSGSKIEHTGKELSTNQMGDPSMYPDPSSPHGASQQAAVASMHDNDDMRKHALEALDSSRGGEHKEAADSHLKAAKLHEKAATGARKDKDPNLADAHDQAAGMHRKAASIHSAVTNSEGEQEGTEESTTELTKNQGETMTKTQRVAALKKLTANCKCEEDKVALNSLSDEGLSLILNAKPDSSNASGHGGDAVNNGDTQAGGEEENEEVSDDEFTDRAEAGTKAKKTKLTGNVTANEWLASAPPEIRSAVHNSMKIERREKSILVRRLVANVADGDRRKSLITNFMKKPLEELVELVSLLPAPTTNHGYEQDPSPLYLGAETPGTTTENRGQDDGDILDLPTLNYKEIVEEMNTAGRRGSSQRQQA